MLKIERQSYKFRITSSPQCLDISVRTPEEIGVVVRHYYGGGCAPDCPVCAQITARLPKADELALHRPTA